MDKYNYKRRHRKTIAWYYSKPVIIILLILFILIIKGTWGVYRKAHHGKELLQIVETEYQTLEDKEQRLIERLDRVKTQTGQEEQIREKFNVSKFNEKLVVIVDREEPATTTPPEKTGFEIFFNSLLFWK